MSDQSINVKVEESTAINVRVESATPIAVSCDAPSLFSVYGLPLTIAGQKIRFNYNANHFSLSGNNLQISLTGTANQVIVTDVAGSINLSGPQDIAATSSPSFYGATITQQNSTAGVVIKNAATFDPAYPPLKFADSAGTYTGSMYIDMFGDIRIGQNAGIYFHPTHNRSNVMIGQNTACSALLDLEDATLIGHNVANQVQNLTIATEIGSYSGLFLVEGSYLSLFGNMAGMLYGAERWITCVGNNIHGNITGPTVTVVTGAGLGVGDYYYCITFVFGAVESTTGSTSLATTTTGNQKINLTDIPIYDGPLTCTARNIYRTKIIDPAISVNFYLLSTLGDNSTVIYDDTTADGALGTQLTKEDNVVALGNYLITALLPNTMILGGGGGLYPIPDVYFNDLWASSPVSMTLHSQGGSGTDVAGSDFTIAPGQGTGAADGGRFVVKKSPAGATGSTWNDLEDALVINSDGEITGGKTEFKTVSFGTLYSNGSSGDTKTIDWNNGQKQSVTLTGAPCVFTFTAPTLGTGNFLLKCIQGSGGSMTVTWPGTVLWPSATAPTLSSAEDAVDIISFFYDGTNYYGSSSLNFS